MTPKSFAAEMRDAADVALEREIVEKSNGFLQRPYTRYRYHSGFESGARWCLGSEVVSAMYEAIKEFDDACLVKESFEERTEEWKTRWEIARTNLTQVMYDFEAARGEK